MPKLKINDTKIYYNILGEGEPICLIMGWGGSSDAWYRQPELLAKTHKVILIDNRGTGRSSKPNIPYKMETFVEDIKSVLDHLNITKLHLMGCSMGGMISQHFALSYPKMLGSLILCCTTANIKTPGVNDVDPENLFAISEVTPEALKNVFSFIFTPKYIDWLFSEDGKKEFSNLISVLSSHPPTAKTMRNQFNAIKTHNTLDQLKDIKIPTLVLVGKQDILLPPRNSKILAKNIPKSELKILNGGHMFWIEEEKEFFETVKQFLIKNPIKNQ